MKTITSNVTRSGSPVSVSCDQPKNPVMSGWKRESSVVATPIPSAAMSVTTNEEKRPTIAAASAGSTTRVHTAAEAKRRNARELSLIGGVREAVAEPSDGLDQIERKLLAQAPDEDLDRIRIAVEITQSPNSRVPASLAQWQQRQSFKAERDSL
jgi:hypothetical protein